MTNVTRRELLSSVLVGAAAGGLPSVAASTNRRAEPFTLPLYEGPIPNAIDASDEEATRDPAEEWVYRKDVSRPTLSVHLPAVSDAKRAAVIICPGGSYKGVSIDKEGYNVARAFNAFGVAAMVLKYRTPSPRHMKDTSTGPLQDAQQALHVAHQRASEWRIDPQRVGIVGFSAGGHLAASASTRFAHPVLSEHRHSNLRPAFSILMYAVISMTDELTHLVSREQLLGPSFTQEQIDRASNERNVTDRTPPAFLVHAADDTAVRVANSLRYFEALNARKIPAQLFVYPQGGHGYGLNNATTPDRWIDRAQQWMQAQEWIAG